MTRAKRRTTGDSLLDAAIDAVEKDRPDEADELRERLCEDAADTEALSELGDALDDIGLVDEAVAIWRRLVEVDPTHSTGWFNLGVAAKDEGRHGEAIALFDRAIEHDPGNPSALHCRGHMYQEIGDAELGRADLERAIALYSELLEDEPDHAEAWYWRGAARARLGDREAALADLAAAIVLEPIYACEARGEVDYAWLASDREFIRLTSRAGEQRH